MKIMIVQINEKKSLHTIISIIVMFILAINISIVMADPGFTLENVKTWRWGDDTTIKSIMCADADGDVEIVTGGHYDDGSRDVAQLCMWDGATLAFEHR